VLVECKEKKITNHFLVLTFMISIEKYQGLRNFGKMKPNGYGYGTDFWYCASIDSLWAFYRFIFKLSKSVFVEVMIALLIM
jgi:hypothetical protein